MEYNKRFAPILIFAIIIGFLAIAGGAYYIGKNSSPKNMPEDNSNYVPVTQNYNSSTNYNTNTPTQNPKATGVSTSTQVTTTVTQNQPSQNPTSISWKIYTDTKYSFSFQYPSTWSQAGTALDAMDLSGSIIMREIDFQDSTNKTTLSVQYHLAPKGAEIYKAALSDFNSSQGWYTTGKKQLVVGGKNGKIALESVQTLKTDGRGNAINPMTRIIVDFLDTDETGSFQFQFNTSSSSKDTEIANFNKLISSFEFI